MEPLKNSRNRKGMILMSFSRSFNGRFEHEGDLISTRRNSEEIFALTRAFFRGVKLENRTCRSEVRKLALFRENR